MKCSGRLLLFYLISAAAALPGTVQPLPALPNGATAQALQLDAAGNIFVAGSLAPASPKSSADTSDAFVAELAPDGSKVVYFTVLGGSGADQAAALAVGSDDSVYVTGATSSRDFPVTSRALETMYGGAAKEAFAAKLGPNGAIVYATYIGGGAMTGGIGIAADAAGDAFVLGTGAPEGVAAIAGGNTATLGGFVMKIDPAGSKMLAGFTGLGGEYIAIDGAGSVYLAGISVPPTTAPVFTAGAFQTVQPDMLCAGDIFFSTPCTYEYVAKVDATGTKLIYLTGLNGTYGATPAGIAVDASGNAMVAGTTNSPDFPVTAGTLEGVYAPVIPSVVTFVGPGVPEVAPPETGFAAKLNATGSGLVWGTFFGGSTADSILAMAVDAEGGIVVGGAAASDDLPGTEDAPQGCRPSAIQYVSFAARLAPDGSSLSAAQLLYGATSYAWGPRAQATGLSLTSGPAAIASGTVGAVVDVEQTGLMTSANLLGESRLACVTDPADNAQISSVAAGEDVSLFGEVLAPTVDLGIGGQPPLPNGVSAMFGGSAATVLYTSTGQVNVELPAAIAGPSTQMTLTNSTTAPPLDETRTFYLAPEQPSVFLTAAALVGGTPAGCLSNVTAPLALAVNADGSVNSASNPAAMGSMVTIFLNGVAEGAAITAVANQGEADQTAITFTAGTRETGVLPVSFRVPASLTPGLALSEIEAGGVAAREGVVMVCVTP